MSSELEKFGRTPVIPIMGNTIEDYVNDEPY